MTKAFGFEANDVEFPIGSQGETYHVGAEQNTAVRYWILPGSYERAESAGELWTNLDECPFPRGTRLHQYHALTGEYQGVRMGICSTGIGASAGEILINELTYGGARYFVRGGSSGCLDKEILCGDLVIINESRGNVGTVMEYLGRERMFDFIPSSPKIVDALEQACRNMGLDEISGEHTRGDGFKIGRGYCADSFYAGQGREGFCPLTPEMRNLIPELIQEKILTIEMETPGLAAVITAHQERASEPYNQIEFASIVTPVANRITNDWNEEKKYQLQMLKAISESFVLLDNQRTK